MMESLILRGFRRMITGKASSILRQALAVLAAGFLLVLPPAATRAEDAPKPHPTVVFMTDFGVIDDSVALCKGVMYSVAPDLRIVDLTHQVTSFSILDGARYLEGASPYFPAGPGLRTGIDPAVRPTWKDVVL